MPVRGFEVTITKPLPVRETVHGRDYRQANEDPVFPMIKTPNKQATIVGDHLRPDVEKAMLDFAFTCALGDAIQQKSNHAGPGGKSSISQNEGIRTEVKAYVNAVLGAQNPTMIDYAKRIFDKGEEKKSHIRQHSKVAQHGSEIRIFRLLQKSRPPESLSMLRLSDGQENDHRCSKKLQGIEGHFPKQNNSRN